MWQLGMLSKKYFPESLCMDSGSVTDVIHLCNSRTQGVIEIYKGLTKG